MEYRRLGASGLKVSALSLGSWITFAGQGEETQVEACMKQAYEAGVNFFDTAEEYNDGKAETVMGNIIKKAGWKRSDIVISTKIFWGGNGPNDKGLSRKHIIEGANASLVRLQLDYVDLIYCHRPDIHTPIEETVRAMSYLVDCGKAFYWGTSEWSAEQIREAYNIARREHLVPPTMEQPQYNMFYRSRVEKEYARLYHEIGLGTTIYSPLACGVLTGKYNNGIPRGTRASLPGYQWLNFYFEGEEAERNIEKVRQLTAVAEGLGSTMAQLALAWCLKNPNVSSVITGASRPEQVDENMKAIDMVKKLTPAVMAQVEQILGNKPEPETDHRL
ncbi:MAG: voltage-dependent potassium channel subunit beta [bacterium]|nr:voltage-dependent potassium channel subunit beta [bacterium]